MPPQGFYNEPFLIIANDQFLIPDTLKATFTWADRFRPQASVQDDRGKNSSGSFTETKPMSPPNAYSAEDHVRLIPITVDIEIAGLEGNTVPESLKKQNGSITSIVGPGDSQEDLTKWALSLPKVAIARHGCLRVLRIPMVFGFSSKRSIRPCSSGSIQVIQNGAVWMAAADSSKELTAADLSGSFSLQATYGGVVTCTLWPSSPACPYVATASG